MSDTPDMSAFGKALVEKTVDELARWMVKGNLPAPELGSLMVVIHYVMEISAERLGASGVRFMLESAEMFATAALEGPLAVPVPAPPGGMH